MAVLLSATMLLFCLVSRWRMPEQVVTLPPALTAELSRLRAENEQLHLKLTTCEAVSAAGTSSFTVGGGAGAASSAAGPTASGSGGALTRELLELHSHWDWQSIARRQLQPFSYIDPGMIEMGIKACFENGTMYAHAR